MSNTAITSAEREQVLRRPSVAGKIAKWTLGILLLLLLGFFYGFVPWFLTGIATTNRFHFRDQNDGKSPKDLGMDYHDVAFTSSDGIPLKGWYIPAAPGSTPRGTIVYCHGLNRTRAEMIPEQKFGYSLGYNGLLFDFRHQGESGGNVTSIGYWERLDAEAAVRYALSQERAQRPLILWGVSMGAAASLMAAAESSDVAAVISDSAFPNFDEVIRHHYYLFRSFARRRLWWFPPLPGFPLINEVIYWISRRGHFNAKDFDVEQAVIRINPRPILFVGVEGDLRMPPWYAQEMYAASRSPHRGIVILPGNRHGEGFNQANAQFEEAVRKFLNDVNPIAPASASHPGARKHARSR